MLAALPQRPTFERGSQPCESKMGPPVLDLACFRIAMSYSASPKTRSALQHTLQDMATYEEHRAQG